VADPFRIEELRRKVHQDPQSIAFAQLAEALRRTGHAQEAVDTCRAGLSNHPGYLSAHVTLGRALIEIGDLEGAETELTRVLDAAPENLAAVKGLADIHQRRGEVGEALDQYRRALELAPHDAELEQTVSELEANLGPTASPADAGGNGSLAEAPAVPTAVPPVDEVSASEVQPPTPAAGEIAAPPAAVDDTAEGIPPPALLASLQVDALERWLDAILADRERQR
jgi:tetratricopeptide (TPR) repeat protein